MGILKHPDLGGGFYLKHPALYSVFFATYTLCTALNQVWCFFQSCCHFKRAFSSDCVTTRLRNILAGLMDERRASLAEAITLGELLYINNMY